MVKHVDAVELRVVAAAVLVVAADAVLLAKHVLKLGASLVTALARLHVRNLARRSSLETGKKLWQFGTGNRKCRWRAREYPEQKNEVVFPFLPHEPWAPCKERSVWAGAVILASATCSLQFAKASAATLLQQEKKDSEDVQQAK